MTLLLFLKVFADMCLCYAVLGSLPGLFAVEFSLLWPAILAGSSVALASILYFSGYHKLRYLCIGIPLIALLFCSTWIGAMLILPALIYSGAIIFQSNYALEYYNIQGTFRKALTWLGLFFVIILTLSVFESSVPGGQNFTDYKVTFFYGLLYCFCGVILQRQLRLGTENETKDLGKKKAIISVIALTFCILGVLAVAWLLRSSANSALDLLINGVALVIGAIAWVLRMLFDKADPEFKDEFLGNTIPPETTPTATMPTFTGAEKPIQDVVKLGFPWWLVILLMGAMVIVLLIMLRNFFVHSNSVGTPVQEEKISPEKQEKRQKKRSNRSKIRHYYRQFLRFERKKGLKYTTTQTSADILASVSPLTNRAAAAALREEYLHARYDHATDITDAQVARAKSALKKIRGGS